jgi:hypothetical protein
MSKSPHPRATVRANARNGVHVRGVNGARGTRSSGSAKAGPAEGKSSACFGLVKTNGRLDEVVAFEESVISFFVQAADLIGAPKSIAAIYGICFASPEPIGFVEIQERLNLSLGSLSQGLKILREVGALKIAQPVRAMEQSMGASNLVEAGDDARKPADNRRSIKYEPNLESRKLIASWIDQKLQRQLNSGRSQLESLLSALPEQYGTNRRVVKGRLEHLQSWHAKASALLPIVKAFLKVS